MPSGADVSSTSTSLIERARHHDPEAWSRLCFIYGPLVYRWARVVGLQHTDAADVGQEVFATVARRLGTFDHSRPGATFRGWLKTITRNKIGDFLKRQAAREEVIGGSSYRRICTQLPDELSDAPLSDPPLDIERLLLHRTLAAIRAEFEPHTWQAFWFSVVDGLSTAEIAERLTMSRKAVRQARYRVLRRLRIEFGPAHDQK